MHVENLSNDAYAVAAGFVDLFDEPHPATASMQVAARREAEETLIRISSGLYAVTGNTVVTPLCRCYAPLSERLSARR
jgi:hypothetical protein